MPYTITGRTFDYRDKLKSFGARWDNDTKQWTMFAPSDAQLALIKSWPGVIISGSGVIKTEDNPRQDALDRVKEARKTLITTTRREPSKVGHSAFYGDEPTYHGYFAEKTPRAFMGFSSLPAMIDFIEATSDEVKRDYERNPGWRIDRGTWSGSEDMDEAIDLARNGIPELSDDVAEIVEKISMQHAVKRGHRYSAVGGVVSVPRLLAGNPMAMRRRDTVKGRRTACIFIEASTPSNISAQMMLVRSIAIAAMVDVMEREGYSCEITTIHVNANNGPQLAVTVKRAGDKLNINDSIFALGHPSFNRRFVFACYGNAPELCDDWSGMGTPMPAFTNWHPTKENEFYIPQRRVSLSGDTLAEQALNMLRFIQPTNLPIKVLDDDNQHDQ